MNRIISICNHKGGVGKTTSVLNIGAGLNELNKKTLMIDMDPQANLSQSVGVDNEVRNTYQILKAKQKPSPIKIKNKLHIIPATQDLSNAENELLNQPGREFILREALISIQEKYDFIIIDSPPSLGLLTLNALTSSKEVFIPLQTQYLAIHGLTRLTETIELVKQRLNPHLILNGIILTQYDKRKVLNREIDDTIRKEFGDKVFNTIIRENIALAEAPLEQSDIFTYAGKSHGALDYMNLTNEIITQKF